MQRQCKATRTDAELQGRPRPSEIGKEPNCGIDELGGEEMRPEPPVPRSDPLIEVAVHTRMLPTWVSDRQRLPDEGVASPSAMVTPPWASADPAVGDSPRSPSEGNCAVV
jgi:hypothetical protein